ncbi:Aste57867_22052 [Aphanomyces stellatus]|uniref:Aste57867_22052 protein n=1 Tax=Aphanomyces stellatus TaxID=120398 RepID=A0A485LKI6_9STRA|nr:hypothetical protein As57867_021983 [Aphanomyces stellatus]VFT98720.1 Aste57867_22052 [Aphanomyces stellatus]
MTAPGINNCDVRISPCKNGKNEHIMNATWRPDNCRYHFSFSMPPIDAKDLHFVCPVQGCPSRWISEKNKACHYASHTKVDSTVPPFADTIWVEMSDEEHVKFTEIHGVVLKSSPNSVSPARSVMEAMKTENWSMHVCLLALLEYLCEKQDGNAVDIVTSYVQDNKVAATRKEEIEGKPSVMDAASPFPPTSPTSPGTQATLGTASGPNQQQQQWGGPPSKEISPPICQKKKPHKKCLVVLSKTDANKGRYFYRCPDCGFYMWCDEYEA